MYARFFIALISFLLLFVCKANTQDLIINEILSSNTNGIQDSYGDYSDWIEIYNSSSSSINLNGYFLSDNTSEPLKWEFPEVSIAGHSYLLVFATEKMGLENEWHCNFKLLQEGEPIILSNPNGLLVDRLDSVFHQANISYGHEISGSGSLKYFDIPTPLADNQYEGYHDFLDPPHLSHPAGFYEESIEVSALHEDEDLHFRYTLDGSDPSEQNDLYTVALLFDNAVVQANSISEIPTNPSFNYPQPGFTENRANNRGWLPPYENINKVNVLKIRSFKEGYFPSEPISATYIINPETINRYQLPVLSITTDVQNFFDDEMGIYVYGTAGEEGNYAESGREWERPVHLQFFEKDGSLAFEQDFGARIHGGGGRHSTLKNIRIYSRDDYGKNSLEYKWFDNDETNEFKRFLVRGAGHRPDCSPRDDFASLLLEKQNMDQQHVRHIIVFLNGEYWGLHTIKERFDQKYLSQKYGKKDEDYTILINAGRLDSGELGDEDSFTNLLDYVGDNDMSLDENYDHVKAIIDMDNYLTYFTSEVFMGNVDWIVSNIKFWRYKGFDDKGKKDNGLDGKWRWFMYDFDLTFGGSCKEISPFINVLDDCFDVELGKYTILARGLKNNEQFVDDFVNRMCDHMNSNFSKKNFREKLSQIDGEMSPEMAEHIQRWRYPSTSTILEERQYELPSLDQWDTILTALYHYPSERKRKIIDHLQEEFGLQDTLQILVDVNDQMMGNVKVNSILINNALEGVSDELYPWRGTYFKEVPIHIIAQAKLGYRFVEWLETSDTNDSLILNLNEGDTLTALFEKDPDFIFEDALFINELMAINAETIQDEYQAHPDWIEIYNPNEVDIDLADYYLTDDIEEVFKYQFPRGIEETIIEAYAFIMIWCDGRPERGALHTNFKLDGEGESILFTAPDSSAIDQIIFGQQYQDISYGRQEDGAEEWKLFQIPDDPTPGATNNKTAISEMIIAETLMYPNPVSQGAKVYFKDKVSIKIYNYLGQMVFDGQDLYQLERSSLQKGIYIIHFEGFRSQKLLVK